MKKIYVNTKSVTPNATGDFTLGSNDYSGSVILTIYNANFNYQSVLFESYSMRSDDAGAYFVRLRNILDNSPITVPIIIGIISVDG